MTYTSISFFFFLAVVLLCYYAAPVAFRWIALLVGSIAFYFLAYKSGWWILLTQILLTYASGICIGHLRRLYPDSSHKLKKTVFAISLAFVILPWFFIKNGDFLWSIFRLGKTFAWIVPLGISFYTLQMISYLADIYKGKIRAQENLAKYALFILFFPQIVQGPIPRYGNLAEQLYKGHMFDEKGFVQGAQTILWGFFLKFMIADKAAIVVNEIFSRPYAYAGCYVLVAGALYSVELYTDFLACTKICIGIAQLFGIHLTDNFMRPYLAVSIKDFWRRWHISLSSWLRDYVYIPMGGSKKGKMQRYLNLAVTFAVSGIWHGAGYKFLVWGLLHAAYQIAGSVTAGMQERVYCFLPFPEGSAVRKMLQRMGVFFWVMLGWIIFRADSLTTGLQMIKSIFTLQNPWILFDDSLFSLGLKWKEWCALTASIGILALVGHRQESGRSVGDAILSMPLYLRWTIYIIVILSIMLFGTYGFGYNAQDFIYGGF